MAPEATHVADNPEKKAAIHLGAFLQLNNQLEGGNVKWGGIEQNKLVEQFCDIYQPRYNTTLLLNTLVSTLRKYGVAKHGLHKRKNKTPVIRINKHPSPTDIPAPEVVTRPRTYVDQTRIMRDPIHLSEPLNELQCKLCNETFTSEQEKDTHVDSDLHKFRLLYRKNKSLFKCEVPGASVAVVGEGSDETTLRTGQVTILNIAVTTENQYEDAKVFKIYDVNDSIRVDPTQFSNNEPIRTNVTAQFTEIGSYLYPLVFKMSPPSICVMKELRFHVGSELIDHLGPVSPYVNQKSTTIREMEGSLVPGEWIERGQSRMRPKVGLADHRLPAVYTKLLLHQLKEFNQIKPSEQKALTKVLELLCGSVTCQEARAQVAETQVPFTSPLNPTTHTDRFHLLMDLEEMQQLREIKNYDRTGETLKQSNKRFILELPDLSEGRPSVTKGDSVHVKFITPGNGKVIYEGIIHEIKDKGILLGFNGRFSEEYNSLKANGETPKVDVRFTMSRWTIRLMHRALRLLSKHKAVSLVFPTLPQGYLPPTNPPTLREWINPVIGNNPEQQRAIQNIIGRHTSDSAPYIIYGPPGTGKTVTMVETIVQVWYANQTNNTKQLVCAPSNEASNNLARRLLHMLPGTAKLLRLFALTAEEINIPDSLRPHSNYDKKFKQIYIPSLEEVMDYHIVVVTLVSAGRLVTAGASGMFQYVYIDECGQATEPETLVAVAGLLTSPQGPSNGQLILAGDPQQLGPMLSSQLATDFGLGVSLLERLMKDNSLYQKGTEAGGYDPKYITKLVQNFRSHETILRVPNQLFYDNELLQCGNPDVINTAIGWSELPNKNIPIMFHGVQGLDERESNSPSYFNRLEIDVVVGYMKKLFKHGLPNKRKVTAEDIGVITPYRKQVRKFEKAFEMQHWKDVGVGSVEWFQGSEKLIIFISTVRSNMALIDEDFKFKLGFLKNPKRFNVSVTRAKALLVVVGNPKILRHDKHWYKLLKYCRDNGMYKGMSFPQEPPQEEQIVS